MDSFWEFVKQIIATRGAQLASRYVSKLLLIVATWAHMTSDADGHVAAFIVSLLVAIAGMGIDLLSHAIQKDQTAREIEAEREIGRQMVERALDNKIPPPSNPFRSSIQKPLMILALCLLPLLAGCSASHYAAGIIATGVESAMTRIHTSFAFDPATMTATATLQFKDESGRDVVQVFTPEELKARCLAQNDRDTKQLKDTYRQTLKDIESVQKRELANLKRARGKCGYQYIPAPHMQPVPPPAPQGPQVGDIIPASPDDFVIPGVK